MNVPLGLGLCPMVDLNPMHWLGDAAKEGVADGFTAMMMALWSAALWLLQSVFGLLDQFTTPHLDDPGLAHLYSVTAGASVVVALVVALGQIGLTAIRQDGRPMATLAAGLAQYGAVLTIWVGVCTAVVLGCAGLTKTLLSELLDVDSFGGYAAGAGWVDHVTGTVEASVLGVCALLMLIPAALGYLVIMLAREAALLILVATMPIAAAGALSESTRAWMWKSIRWFLAACLTAPLLALVLGLGVQIGHAAIPSNDTTASPSTTSPSAVSPSADNPHATPPNNPPPGGENGQPSTRTSGTTGLSDGSTAPQTPTAPAPSNAARAPASHGTRASATDPASDSASDSGTDSAADSVGDVPDTSANVGLAVVGCVIMLVGCFCPLALFRLLAFVDPGTGSGAAFRSTLAASGGVTGLFAPSRSRPESGTGGTSAQAVDDTGRSASESSAEAATTTRFATEAGRAVPSAGRAIGSSMGALGGVAGRGASLGVDVMGQAGVGHQGYYDTTPRGGPPSAHPAHPSHPSHASTGHASNRQPDHPGQEFPPGLPAETGLHGAAGTTHEPGVPRRTGLPAEPPSGATTEPGAGVAVSPVEGSSGGLGGPVAEDAVFLA